jgi:hypothetical protein
MKYGKLNFLLGIFGLLLGALYGMGLGFTIEPSLKSGIYSCRR